MTIRVGYFILGLFSLNIFAQDFDLSFDDLKKTHQYNNESIQYPGFSKMEGDIRKNIPCYSGNCLYTNIAPLLNFNSEVDQILSFEQKSQIKKLNNLIINYKKKNINEKMAGALFQGIMDIYNKISPVLIDEPRSPILILSISQACDLNNNSLSSLKTGAVTEKIKLLSIGKCMKDNFLSFSLSCNSLMRDTFSIIDEEMPGTYLHKEVNFFVNNPRFDDFAIKFVNELNKIDKYEQNKKIDLGEVALKITGNLKDAIMLVELMSSDIGAGMGIIPKYFEIELRKNDYDRYKKLKKIIFGTSDNIYKIHNLLKISDTLFGMSFKTSPKAEQSRNYKALAAAVGSLFLSEKGYSEKQVIYANQFVAESYKIQRISSDFNTPKFSSNEIYFVTDSAAANVGASLGFMASKGKKLQEFNFNSLTTEAYKTANNHWLEWTDLIAKKDSLLK